MPAAADTRGVAPISLSLDQIEQLCRAQAVAIDAGLDRNRATGPAFVGAVPPAVQSALRAGARAGEPPSTTLGRLGVLDGISLALLSAAEARGDLASAFTAIADRCAERRAHRRQLVRRLTYPALLLLGVVLIPPIPSVVTGGLSAYLARVIAPLLLLLGIALGLRYVSRAPPSDPLRHRLMRLAAALPPLSGISVALARARFAEVLGATLGAGLDVRASLQWAVEAAEHPRLSPASAVIARVEAGDALHLALAVLPGLDARDRGMIAQGEQSGALDEVLPRLSRLHREWAEARTLTVLRVGAGLVTALIMAMAAVSIVSGFAATIPRGL